MSLKSIKLLSTTSGEISPTTNRIINLLSSSFKGIRDDLEFLLKEDLSSINLYALHCELRNTEELLSSLGLFLYKVGSLDECNDELANYDPENFSSRITVTLKEGQETAVEKHNIQVSSFSGTFYIVSFFKISLSCEFKSCLFLSVLFFLKVLLNVSSSQTLKRLSGTPCFMTN